MAKEWIVMSKGQEVEECPTVEAALKVIRGLEKAGTKAVYIHRPTPVKVKPKKNGKTVKFDFDAKMKAAKEKIERQKAEFRKVPPPLDPTTLTSESVIEGQTVAHWASQEGEIPGWAVWAVRNWKEHGSPSPATKVLDKITKLREDAEEQAKFAALDKTKAEKQGDPVKKKKLLKAAQSKSDKAAKLFAEADQIAAEHKEKA